MPIPYVTRAPWQSEYLRRVPRSYPFSSPLPVLNVVGTATQNCDVPTIRLDTGAGAGANGIQVGESNLGNALLTALKPELGSFDHIIDIVMRSGPYSNPDGVGSTDSSFGIMFGSMERLCPMITGNPSGACYFLRGLMVGAGQWQFGCCSGGGAAASIDILSGVTPIDGVGHKFTFVYRAGVSIECYIDGVLLSTLDPTITAGNFPDFDSNPSTAGFNLFCESSDAVGSRMRAEFAALSIQTLFP